ncbi:MAG: hypothetical protein MHMPM18_000625 [Marteilia pararefringens]
MDKINIRSVRESLDRKKRSKVSAKDIACIPVPLLRQPPVKNNSERRRRAKKDLQGNILKEKRKLVLQSKWQGLDLGTIPKNIVRKLDFGSDENSEEKSEDLEESTGRSNNLFEGNFEGFSNCLEKEKMRSEIRIKQPLRDRLDYQLRDLMRTRSEYYCFDFESGRPMRELNGSNVQKNKLKADRDSNIERFRYRRISRVHFDDAQCDSLDRFLTPACATSSPIKDDQPNGTLRSHWIPIDDLHQKKNSKDSSCENQMCNESIYDFDSLYCSGEMKSPRKLNNSKYRMLSPRITKFCGKSLEKLKNSITINRAMRKKMNRESIRQLL